MNVLGIMSGTSIDSVDYALCTVSEKRIELREWWKADFPKALREGLHTAARGDLTCWAFSQLHHDLGRFYARHADGGSGKLKAALVGLHGQTVFHSPKKINPATFQLGEPAYLVEKLRVPVVNNFRAADLAADGQGAPLATIFHQFVFGERGKHVCVNNLGGISNVTSIEWRVGTSARSGRANGAPLPQGRARGAFLPCVLAFDTGPANMLIDFAIRHFTGGKKHFDKNGACAARGIAAEDLLERWLRHPYFKQKPPKSTGRELFGESFFKTALREMRGMSKVDVAATFTELTGRSIALNYDLHLPSQPDKIILTGGGAAKPTLVRVIRERFEGESAGCTDRTPQRGVPTQFETRRGVPATRKIEVLTSDQLGWPVEAIEPAAFALLAFLRVKNLPGNFPETTGASRAVLCGQISEP